MGKQVFYPLHGEEAPVCLIFLVFLVICGHKDLCARNAETSLQPLHFIFIKIYFHLCVYAGAHRSQERVSDPLELEL